MSSLQDALFKAGIASKKDIKKVKHEERVKKTILGTEGLEKEKELRQESFVQKQEEQKMMQREQEQQKKKGLEEKEKLNQISEIILRNKVDDLGRPERKFYYITRSGVIPFFSLSNDFSRRLERGDYAIVESPNKSQGSHFVLDRANVLRIKDLDEKWIRFCN
jgi:hypothetical protein